MKNFFFLCLQFVIFMIVFAAGSFFPPFNITHVLTAAPGYTRLFIADGLILMVALCVLIVIVQAVTKRLRKAAPWTLIALVLATIVGLHLQFGFKTPGM